MPVNPYDDRKFVLRRPHGNGDMDIVRASNTRRKANVTEAFVLFCLLIYLCLNKETVKQFLITFYIPY